MSRDAFLWAFVLLMGASNFVIRLLPVTVVSRLEMPRPIERWLSYIPVAVLATIVTSEVLRPDGIWLDPWTNPYLFAAIPTGLVYLRTRSFIAATLLGIVFFLGFRTLMG